MLSSIVVRSVAAATALLCFSASSVHGKPYEKFQALGFGIYTGTASAVLGNNISCSRMMEPPDCPSNQTVIAEYYFNPQSPLHYEICLECAILNTECECNKTTLTCSGSTGSPGDLGCYLGFNDTEKDVKGRVAVMEDAVEKAYELSDKDETTLKVFNAPEFFWRGPTGGYPASSIFDTDDEFNPINQIAQALQRIVEQKKFEDWLFVFGTVIAVEQVNATEYAYYNFALTYKGFDPSTMGSSGMRFVAPKQYIAGGDFLSRSEFSDPDFVPDPVPPNTLDAVSEQYDNEGWNRVRTWLQERDYTMIDNAWFVIDGIALTLEICLDYAQSRAKTYFPLLSAANEPLVPSGGAGRLDYVPVPPSMAQIQIVTSGGMFLYPPSYSGTITSGGSSFLQDGLWPTLPGLRTCTVEKTQTAALYYECAPEWVNNSKRVMVYDTPEEAYDAISGLYSAVDYLPGINVYNSTPLAFVAAQQSDPPTSSPIDTTNGGTDTSHGSRVELLTRAVSACSILVFGWLIV